MSVGEFLERVRPLCAVEGTVLVSGNDSADLDSIISCILFAYWSTQTEPNKVYVPVVKVAREELSLRPELAHVLGKVGLGMDHVLCGAEIPLNQQVILIDHNVATAPFNDEQVVGVLDHHVDEGKYKHCKPRTIAPVGSCISLVLAHFPEVKLDAVTGRLALAPLLVDTINLRWDLGRTTAMDQASLTRLAPWAEDRQAYFDAIEAIKKDVDRVSNTDLLRKDYKQFTVGPYQIGTSAIPWFFEAWFKREGGSDPISQSVHQFAHDRKLDLQLVLTAYDHQGDYRRQLALFVYHPDLLPLLDAAEASQELKLAPIHTGCYYQQHNIHMSRKQVWPWCQHWIKAHLDSDVNR
ncbi:hypothetical protein BY458DRAFT_509437 [Sporodiniella umbellata]|nr:hypothetical protein BY458DRAFT_509437 [Sporodiniella umbellata]